MEKNNIILIAIGILVIALLCIGAYSIFSNGNGVANVVSHANDTDNNNKTTDFIQVNDTVDEKFLNNYEDNATKMIGDHTPRNGTNNTNQTYKVYNPQSDSYETVIGEKFDSEVNRWYTYDEDGVRYYNTRIN